MCSGVLVWLGLLFSALSSVRAGCESVMCLPVCVWGGGVVVVVMVMRWEEVG